MAAKSKSGSNTITGTAGADHLNGGSGGDFINGMGGNDRINAGSGDDVMDGGSGNDIVNGDAGNDTGIYILSENAGSTDVYDGGSGIDTLQLVMTRAEWQSPSVQADIARYLAFLAQVTNPVNGQATNANFTFSFGLTVSKFETLKITVDGVAFDPRDEAVTLVNDVMTAGEDSASISVDVLANDSVPDLIATLTNTQPAHGSVTLTRTSGAPATPDTASFVYTPDATHWQYLAAGETATDTFTYTVTDSDGDTRTATVTVTITGSNDAPTLGAVVAAGATIEDGTTSVSGDIAFADVDASDVHTVTTAADGDGYVGAFGATVTDDSTGDGTGTVTWTFDVDDAAIQYLAVGEVLTQTYTVTVSDGQGGTVDQSVTVTITGTNDAPTIIAADAAGGVSETNPVTAPSAASTPVLAEVESNDSFATAQVIDRSLMRIAPNANLGDQTDPSISVTGAVSAPGAQDVYRIDLAAGELITLDIDFAAFFGAGVFPGYPAGFGLDSFVFIYDSAGNLLNFNDDASRFIGGGGSQANQDSYLQFATPTAGTFFIVVKNWDGDGAQSAGPYTLQVSVDSQNLQLTDTGAITFADVDLTDAHSVGVTAQGAGYLGALTAVISDDTTGGGSGEVAWTFSVANAAVQFLGAGETRTQTYSVVVSDGNGGSVSQDVTITITGENDGPVISTAFSLGQLTEGQGDSISGVISFDDVDLIDTHSVSAEAVDPGYRGAFTAVITDSATGNGGGQITWTFSATDAELANLSEGQSLLQRYVVTVDDGNGGTTQQLVNVTIVGTNDAPTITAAVASGAVQEDGVVAAAGTIEFDGIDLRDSHTVSSAQQGEGYLGVFTAVVTDNGFNDGAGSVSWNFQVDNAAIQHLGAGETLVQNYTVTVSDGRGGTVDQVVAVTITGANDAPVATGDVVTTNEDTSVLINVLANDTDVDGPTLSIVEGSVTATNGTAVIEDGQIRFTPNENYNGQATVTYAVTDGDLQTVGRADITVLSVNDAPVARDDVLVTQTTMQLLTNGSFENGLTGWRVTDQGSGTFSLESDNSPPNNTFTTPGALDGQNYVVTFQSGPGVHALEQSFTVPEGLISLVLSYSSFVQTNAGAVINPAGLTTIGANQHARIDLLTAGSPALSTGSDVIRNFFIGIDGTPTQAWNSVSFDIMNLVTAGQTYDLRFAQADNQGNFNLGVDAVSVVATVGFSRDEDTAFTVTTAELLANDTDVDGDVLTVTAVEALSALGGSVSLANGVITYDPGLALQHLAEGETVTDSFTYTISDGAGGTDTATVSFTVRGTNDGPVAVGDSAATNEDAAIVLTAASLLANDTDVDDDTLTISEVSGLSASGATVSINAAGDVVYDPSSSASLQGLTRGQQTVDTFTYTVTDSQGATSTATVSITVQGQLEAPVANPDAVVVSQNGSVSGNVVANDQVTGSTDNSGNVLVNGSFEDGHQVGPGGLDYPGSIPGWTSVQGSFEVWGTGFQGNIASDGIAFLELDNGGGRDAYSSNLTTDAGREYTLAFDLAQRSGTSASTNQVEFLVNGVSLGIFTPPTTTFTTFTVTFIGSGSDVITFQEPASANNGVGGLIDNLRISADADVFVTAVEGSAGLVGVEVDGSNGGEFTVQSDGSYSFDAAGDFGHLGAGESATTSVTYTVTDDGGSDSTTLTVTVQGENDGPVANNDAVAALEDQAITFDVRSNDTDLDGDTLAVTHINGQAISPGGTVTLQDGGLLSLNPNGALTYTPVANASGEVAFTYTVADGFGGVATASATIDVAAVADAPVLAVGSSTVLNPTDGSAMKTTMTLAAGDVVTFNWDFVAHDYMPFNDFAFASVNGAAFMLGSVQVVGDYGTTGWKTFTFTAPAAGSYSIGVGVSNVNDTSLDSHLLVDNLRVNGVSVYSFEGGLGGWSTLGSVGAEPVHDGVSPTDGAQMASLNSASASAASIESFLGLAPGRLARIAEAVGQQGDEVTVPVSMTLGAGEALEDSYVVITGFPAGSTFNFGEADAGGGWRVPSADLGGNLRISTPDDYSGSFTLTVVATTFIVESGSSASTAPQTITVTIDPAPGATAPQAASLALSSKDADAQILPTPDEDVSPQTVPADPEGSGSKNVGPQTLPGPETDSGSKQDVAQVLPGLQDDDAFLPMPAAEGGRDWAGLSARLDLDLAHELPVFAVDDFLPMTLKDAEPPILSAETGLDLDALFEASPADLALAEALSALTPGPLQPNTLDVENSWHQLPAHDAFQ